MRLQSAIFDMDGTLLDSMHIWNDVGPKTLRSMGIEPAPDLGPRLMLMTFRRRRPVQGGVSPLRIGGGDHGPDKGPGAELL